MRVSALGEIAQAQAETGDPRTGRATAGEALASVPPGPDGKARVTALSAAAMVEALARDIAGAAALAERIEDGCERDRTLGKIASLASSARETPQALSVARAIMGNEARSYWLNSIAETQGRAGDAAGAAGPIGEALEAAREMVDESGCVLRMVGICRVQVEIGDLQGAARSIAEALSVARSIVDDEDRVFALAHIARNQPRLGNLLDAGQLLDEALRAVRRVDADRGRVCVLCEIAEAQSRTGDREAALRSIAEASEAAKGTAGESGCDWNLRVIAEAQATAGDSRAAARNGAADRGRNREGWPARRYLRCPVLGGQCRRSRGDGAGDRIGPCTRRERWSILQGFKRGEAMLRGPRSRSPWHWKPPARLRTARNAHWRSRRLPGLSSMSWRAAARTDAGCARLG